MASGQSALLRRRNGIAFQQGKALNAGAFPSRRIKAEGKLKILRAISSNEACYFRKGRESERDRYGGPIVKD